MSFDTLVDDLARIFDVAGVQRAPILAISQGCALAAAYAARHPERVPGIVMIGGYAQGRSKRSSKRERELAVAMRGMMTAGWDDDYPSLRDLLAQMFVPTASEEQRRQFASDMAKMVTADVMARYREALDGLDIVDLLPKVEAPCLVIHCEGDRVNPIEQGRLLASGLPNSRFRTYDSPNHVPPENDPVLPLILRDIDEFLSGID